MTEDGDGAADGGVPDLDLTSDRDGADPFADDEPEDGGAETGGRDAGGEPDAGGESDPDVPDVSPPAETDDDEVEPVELLVQLAEEGEIEPWDIDIVQVTDAFLDKLDETDLRTTGRALFYASVLLRMKSDGMLADDDEDEEPEPEPWEVAMEGGAPDPAADGFDPVDKLEAEMDRRLDRKNTRGSPETLDELVRELREAERGSWWKDSREYDTSESPHGHARGTQTLDYHSSGRTASRPRARRPTALTTRTSRKSSWRSTTPSARTSSAGARRCCSRRSRRPAAARS